jgi:hypothetical protein
MMEDQTTYYILLSQRNLDRIGKLAIVPLESKATSAGNGLFNVPVSLEVAEIIEDNRLEGEVDDEVLDRLFLEKGIVKTH